MITDFYREPKTVPLTGMGCPINTSSWKKKQMLLYHQIKKQNETGLDLCRFLNYLGLKKEIGFDEFAHYYSGNIFKKCN